MVGEGNLTFQSDICANNHGGNPESFDAWASADRKVMRMLALRFVEERGDEGATADEAAEHFPCFHNTIAPRFTELTVIGLICRRGVADTRPTRAGRMAAVLICTPDGAALCARLRQQEEEAANGRS